MYNKLSDKIIQSGERWIYSAGFNVDSSLNNKERLSIVHTNISSLNANVEDLEILLTDLEFK